ncbi:MAG TPA: response regulator transcription factor [Patescibacteria group bacterium]|nr:response regulator transcription factor [Patescibacteria group bacterium]
MKLLVVEDETLLRDAILALLAAEGFSTDAAANGDDGLYMAEQSLYDLIVLDIMLPGISGLDIVRRLRNAKINTPVLLLTARDRVEDRVTGLDAGADDYLVKPFAVAELLARIRALLRRKTGETAGGDNLSYKQLTLNTKTREAAYGSQPLSLTAREYELLEFLVLNRERILTKEQIFDRLWGMEADTATGIVDVYIHFLRKKLETVQSARMVQTIRGVGYMLKVKNDE